MAAFGLSSQYQRTCAAIFVCGGPFETTAGSELARDPSIEAARAALRATSYNGEPVVVLVANDLEAARISSEVLANRMRQAGFNVDMQVMDWASLLARRTRRDGWSVFGVHAIGIDLQSPITSPFVAFTCTGIPASGYHCNERLTAMFEAFTRATDPAARMRLVEEMQTLIYSEVITIPWGQFAQPALHRAALRNLVPSAIPVFWNVEK